MPEINRTKTSDSLKSAPHSAHYKELVIEPIEFIEKNGLGFHEGNVVKYVSTWRNKADGVSALRKAVWYCQRLIEIAEAEGYTAEYNVDEAVPGHDIRNGSRTEITAAVLPKASASQG